MSGTLLEPPLVRIPPSPSKRTKTFIIATNLHAATTPRHFHTLGVELIERGHRVILLQQPDYGTMEQLDRRINIHTWPSSRPTRWADAAFFFKLLRRYRPHCFLANFGAVNTMCVVGALLRVRHRVAYYHTLTAQIDEDTDLSRGRLFYVRLRKRWLYRLATACIANSAAARQDLVGSFGVAEERCLVWPLSVDDPCGGSKHTSPRRSATPLLVCAGRLQPSKGQDVVIRALPGLTARFPNLRIEFIGDGPMRSRCEILAKELAVAEHCQFTGKLPQAEVMDHLASAWVTVAPSRAEAFGLVNIESMSLGTPVIASGVGGVPDIVRDGMDGFLVPPGDSEILGQKLAILLGNAALREEMGRNARSRFLQAFERSKVVRAQAAWLDELD